MPDIINGRYVLQKLIGHGGMGKVIQTFDRLTGQTVALKRVRLAEELANESLHPEKTHEALCLGLAQEFKNLAGLRHPNIISVLDYGFDDEKQPFYTMTYLQEAVTILQAGQLLNFNGKIGLIMQLLQGLAYLHQRGILHRDIKPENVLVERGTVRLLDFGLSHRSGDELSNGGSPQYMAPEIFEDVDPSPATDLFAVGVLMYELFVDAHPFGEIDLTYFERLLFVEPDFSPVDERLRPFLQSLLAKHPVNRCQSATDMLNRLTQVLDSPYPQETSAIRESYLQAATFVGREEAFDQLIQGMVHAREAGAGVIYLLGGESGVGKSRLIDEFRTHALVAGWQVVIGQEVSEGGNPFQVWQEIVLRLALNVELSDLEAGVLQEAFSPLQDLLKRDIPIPPILRGKEWEQRLSLALISLIQMQTRPTLLVMEDLHWTHRGLMPLKQMQKVVNQLPNLMIIGSYRDDERPRLPKELPGATLIRLNRLVDTEIEALSQAILGENGIRSDLISLLTHETEGNTFFIIEVLRALAEDAGQLSSIGEQELPSAVLTRGMDDLLRRRIGVVDARDLLVLRLAAVIGRQLDLNLLRLLQPETHINQWVQRVSEAAILTIQDREWVFNHDKLRQAVLSQLDEHQLKAQHRLVAEGIEALYPDNQDYFSRLMTHWKMAGDSEKELQYLIPITQRLIEVSDDNLMAGELASRGLVILPDHDPRRPSLLNHQAQICFRGGGFDDVMQIAEDALLLAKADANLLEEAISLNIIGQIWRERSRFQLAKEHFLKALHLGEQIENQKIIARNLLFLGSVAEFQKEYEVAEAYFQRSLAIRQAINDEFGITQCYFFLGMIAAQHYSDFQKSLNYAHRSLEIHQKSGNQHFISRAYSSMGIDYASIGQYELARDYFHKSLEIKERLGYRAAVGHTYMILAEAYFFEGRDYALALGYLQRSLELSMELNAMAMVGIVYGYMTLCHIALGDDDTALQGVLDHFELQATLESDKSNGLVHVAMAKLLIARQEGISIYDSETLINKIAELTSIPITPIAYIKEAVRVSTISQIRMVVLIESAQLAISIGAFDLARTYLIEAQTNAGKIQNRHKLDQIHQLFKELRQHERPISVVS